MTTPTVFRPFGVDDREACLSIFDANCPAFFAPNERADFSAFLDKAPAAYKVCEVDDRVAGAFGLIEHADGSVSLNWIMIDPAWQGLGIGSAIMGRIIAEGRASGHAHISIAASHESAPFFARFGAVATKRTSDGWGPGMDRVDMALDLLDSV